MPTWLKWFYGCNVVDEIFLHSQAIIMITTPLTDSFLGLFCCRAAFLCGSGWTSSRIPTSSSTSTCLKWWTPRSLSSPRPSWMPAPRASTNSAGWVEAGRIGRRRNEAKEQEGRWGAVRMRRTWWITWEVKWSDRRNVKGHSVWSAIDFTVCPLLVSRTLQVTNYSMQRRSPPIRRWWMSKSSLYLTCSLKAVVLMSSESTSL